MMDDMADKTNSNGGTIFVSLLTIIYIGLKLTGYITWSWWWVLSAIWIVFWFVIGLFFRPFGLYFGS